MVVEGVWEWIKQMDVISPLKKPNLSTHYPVIMYNEGLTIFLKKRKTKMIEFLDLFKGEKKRPLGMFPRFIIGYGVMSRVFKWIY